MKTNKSKYKDFCDLNELPVYFNSWWLDATAGAENWDVVLFIKSREVFGVLPFFKKNKWGFSMVLIPDLTQHLGPWLLYPIGQKPSSKLAFEKEAFQNLIDQLPKNNLSVINFHHSITNTLPFIWKGFKSNVRYTYLIENLKLTHNELLGNLSSNTRKNIKKAEKIIKVIENDKVEILFELCELTFKRQGLKNPYTLDLLLNLYQKTFKNKSGKLLMAKDSDGNIHAAMFLVWSNKTVYYLVGGSNPKYRNSEAMTLLIWKAIEFGSSMATEFDFEGTMLESIERFIRGFGAVQKPYFQLTKVTPAFLRPIFERRYNIN